MTVDPSEAPAADSKPLRPDRPALVELAAALLIVGGVVGLLAALVGFGSVPPGAEPFFVAALVLAVGSIAVGLLVRQGRAWLLAVNYAAVLGFIDLLGAGGSPLALMLGVADVAVVGILISHKDWFAAMAVWRDVRRQEHGRPISP